MNLNTKARLVILCLVCLMTTVSLLAQGSSSLCSQFDVLTVTSISRSIDTTTWKTYKNEECGFQIKYPLEFVQAENAQEIVVSGAVVTFRPRFDPSIDKTGVKTNLHDFSVSIGVKDAHADVSHRDASCSVYPHERMLNGLFRVGNVIFTKHCFSEGAVGNRYEKLSYRAICRNTCYEIALFIHSANPDCYPRGAIKIFDPIEILCLFDTMLSTFVVRIQNASYARYNICY